ncbi:hypothetical protein M446_1068 [Methylobacterium sp. 4-46]|nr:hypothetical protein M446_1068 [Methylobacterium sp. 4-46]
MIMVVSLAGVAAIGAVMARFCPWLPMLLASVLLFLGAAIGLVAWGEPLPTALGLACLPVLVLQTSYVIAGQVLEGARAALLKANPAQKTLVSPHGSADEPPGLH